MKTITQRRGIGKALSLLLAAAFILMLLPVTVRAAGEVCEIVGGLQYMTFGEALDASAHGDTIRLLEGIHYDGTVNINGKTITIDLNGHDLNVVNVSGPGLTVYGGGVVNLTGAGSFNVTGSTYGVYVSSGTATVTNATGTTHPTLGIGVCAIAGGSVTVRNDVQGYKYGILAEDSSTSISVGGNVAAANDEGVAATGGAAVTVGGNVTSAGSPGRGVFAQSGGTVTVTGNVSVATGTAAYSWGGGLIEIYGSVQASIYGASAGSGGSVIYIHGNVTCTQIGAYVFQADAGTAVVRIDGAITAGVHYIQVGDESRDGSEASRTLPTLLAGYHTYSSGNNIVYVKALQVDDDPDDVPKTGGGGFPAWPGFAGLALLSAGGLAAALRYKKKKA